MNRHFKAAQKTCTDDITGLITHGSAQLQGRSFTDARRPRATGPANLRVLINTCSMRIARDICANPDGVRLTPQRFSKIRFCLLREHAAPAL